MFFVLRKTDREREKEGFYKRGASWFKGEKDPLGFFSCFIYLFIYLFLIFQIKALVSQDFIEAETKKCELDVFIYYLQFLKVFERYLFFFFLII